MKRLAIAGFIWLALAGLFIAGIFSAQTTMVMIAFCSWTPATLFVGWTLAKAGLRVTIASERSAPIPARQEVQKINRLRKLQEDVG